MPTATGALTAALTELWSAISTNHPELPPIRPALSPRASSPAHGPSRWTKRDDGTLSGLSIGIDVLAAGPEAVVTHMLHEAAHVLNWLRHVTDVSSRDVYHNGEFLTAANEMGLVWPDDMERLPGRGLSSPIMSEETAASWRSCTTYLAPLVVEAVADLAVAEPPKSRPDRLTLVCACEPPRRIRAARSHVDAGPITCGVCGRNFAVQE